MRNLTPKQLKKKHSSLSHSVSKKVLEKLELQYKNEHKDASHDKGVAVRKSRNKIRAA
jgi:hypothetical protein